MEGAHQIIEAWALDPGLHTKEAVIKALALRVGEMLLNDPMGFIHVMYRMDISEEQLGLALDAPEPATQIAQLIWDRQTIKMISRRNATRHKPEDDPDELVW